MSSTSVVSTSPATSRYPSVVSETRSVASGIPSVTRRAVLGAAGTVGAAALAGCLGVLSGPRAVSVREGFEDGLAEWTAAAHVGPDAFREFRYRIDVTEEHAAEGSRSLSVFTEGAHDDGTAWVVRTVPVVRGRAYDATFSVRAWSEGESFNTLRYLVAVLGPAAPETESDFPEPGWNSTGRDDAPVGGFREAMDGPGEGENPEGPGWRTYRFTWRTPELDVDTLHLALGVSVIWEGDRTDFLDDVRLDLVPRP